MIRLRPLTVKESIRQVHQNPHIFCYQICAESETCIYHRNKVEPHEGELPAAFKGTPYCPAYERDAE